MPSIRIKSHYKFSIAAENATFDGYTTEKLVTSFQAHTVPIYWGNPYVGEEFNGEAFVNCNDYDNFDNVVKRVKEIDEDDELWAYMISQSWQTDEQKMAGEKRYENYRKFITHIFTQPLEKARRAPEGSWPNICKKILSAGLWVQTTKKSEYFVIWQKFCRSVKSPRDAFNRILRRIKRKFFPMYVVDPMPETDIDDFFKDD